MYVRAKLKLQLQCWLHFSVCVWYGWGWGDGGEGRTGDPAPTTVGALLLRLVCSPLGLCIYRVEGRISKWSESNELHAYTDTLYTQKHWLYAFVYTIHYCDQNEHMYCNDAKQELYIIIILYWTWCFEELNTVEGNGCGYEDGGQWSD